MTDPDTHSRHLLETLRARAQRYEAASIAHTEMARHARQSASKNIGEADALAEVYIEVSKAHTEDAREMGELAHEMYACAAALQAAVVVAEDLMEDTP